LHKKTPLKKGQSTELLFGPHGVIFIKAYCHL